MHDFSNFMFYFFLSVIIDTKQILRNSSNTSDYQSFVKIPVSTIDEHPTIRNEIGALVVIISIVYIASKGKSLSEAFLFFRTCCVQELFWKSKTISVRNMFFACSELGIFTYWTCNSMNNLSSHCELVDAKIRDSDKDLPVNICKFLQSCFQKN